MPDEIPVSDKSFSGPKPDYAKNILSPKNIIVYLVAAVIIYAGVYYYFFAKNKKAEVTPELASPLVQAPAGEGQGLTGNQMIVELKAQNGSGQDGLVLITEENGKTKVELSTNNTNGTQPAHIHEGACSAAGKIKWPLKNVVDGNSSSFIPVTIGELKAFLPLAINVHKSASEAATYVSCGDAK